MHHQQGRGHHRGLPGGAARGVHADPGRIRGHALHLGKGRQGPAGIQYRAQAGHLHRGELQAGGLRGGAEFPQPQFRAALQRASLPEAHLLPVPDQDHEGAQPHDKQLQRPHARVHHPQGDA